MHFVYLSRVLCLLAFRFHPGKALRCGEFDCFENAECEKNICTCPAGYYGDGYFGCYKNDRCGCYSHGDPKLVSFDKEMFDLPVPCMYLMSRYKGAECEWSIMLETEHRFGARDNSSVWIKRVVWTINTKSGQIDSTGVSFEVSGSLQKMDTNYKDSDISLNKIDTFFILKSSLCDLDLRFDGKLTVSLDVPDTLSAKHLYGLCGDCDGKQTETITVLAINESGTSRTNKLFSFANIIPEKSQSVCFKAKEIYSSCTPDYLKFAFGKSLCGSIFDPNGPFTECRKKADERDMAAIYYFMCLHDYCLNDEVAACDDVTALAGMCELSSQDVTC